MKKYKVQFDYSTVVEIEVLADSEEEAKRKADDMDYVLDEYESTLNYEEVVDVEDDVPDLDKLIKQAEDILKTADEKDIEFELKPWSTVTVPVWDGHCMKGVKEVLSAIFYDKEREELGFEGENGAAELTISDLPEIERYYLAKKIIEQAEDNGIYFHNE